MTTCIESGAMNCLPTNPLDVFNLYDVQYGSGMGITMVSLLLGIIVMAIYLRTRSLAMLAVLGIDVFATFTTLLTSKYISSQYQIMEYVIILAATSAVLFMVMRLVKE